MSVIEQRGAKFFGESCGRHGTYTFYPGLEYNASGKIHHLMLGNFFNISIKSPDENEVTVDLVGELQLVWHDKNHVEEKLSSVKLYGRPEDCLGGRQSNHGQDEILAEETKVVIRLSHLVDLVINSSKIRLLHNHFQKKQNQEKNIKMPLITSYPQYCRYRAAIKRLESIEEKHHNEVLVHLLGRNFMQNLPPGGEREVYFCRDTTSLPALKHFKDQLIHLAPRLKGRKRKKKQQSFKLFESDESNESEVCPDHILLRKNIRTSTSIAFPILNGRSFSHKRRKVGDDLSDKESFLDMLHQFMKENHSPIFRSPTLGFKEVDLHQFFISTRKRGGYKEVTKKKLWKEIYDELGGSSCNTSAATGTRKNYEKYLQPFENFLNGAEAKGSSKKCYKTKSSLNISSCNNNNSSEQTPPLESKSNIEPLMAIRPVASFTFNSEKLSLSECDKTDSVTTLHDTLSPNQSVDQIKSVDTKCLPVTNHIKREVMSETHPQNTLTLSQRLLAGGQALLNTKVEMEGDVSTNRSEIPRDDKSWESNMNQTSSSMFQNEFVPTMLPTQSTFTNLIVQSNNDGFDVQDLRIKNISHSIEDKLEFQDVALDYSMETLRNYEERIVQPKIEQPLDLSIKKVVCDENSKIDDTQVPLDLSKSSRKGERLPASLPISLTQLLPLAFAMPSTIQVFPQVLSPIQQNINMIYNPGSINFPILNFPPRSDMLSPSSR